MKLILASNSPRRKQFLIEYGVPFEVVSSAFSEVTKETRPEKIVTSFAFGKAKEVYERLNDQNIVVLGADTVVSLDGNILGKPKNKDDAIKMLKALSNKTHQVFTGYSIISKDYSKTDYCVTDVTFNQLSDQLITEYVETGLPMDKAGAYGIQDGYNLVKNISGSYNNVVGLPIEIIIEQLKKLLNK